MKLEADKHFLVLNRKAIDSLRRHLPELKDFAMRDIRRVLVLALSEATVVKEFESRLGKGADLECRVREKPFVATLVLGSDREGKPKMSRDGRLQVAFLTMLRATSPGGDIQ
jgi:hypothetical protein